MDKATRGFKEEGQEYIKRILASGGNIYSFRDHSDEHIFVLLRYTEHKLATSADYQEYRMELDAEEVSTAR